MNGHHTTWGYSPGALLLVAPILSRLMVLHTKRLVKDAPGRYIISNLGWPDLFLTEICKRAVLEDMWNS